RARPRSRSRRTGPSVHYCRDQARRFTSRLGPRQLAPPPRSLRTLCLAALVRDGRGVGLGLDPRAVAPGEVGDGIDDRIVRIPGTDHQDRARAGAGSDEDMARVRWTVHEVPCPQRPLLLLDEQEALAVEDEEVLLRRLGVVEAVRLARLEHADVHPDLLE